MKLHPRPKKTAKNRKGVSGALAGPFGTILSRVSGDTGRDGGPAASLRVTYSSLESHADDGPSVPMRRYPFVRHGIDDDDVPQLDTGKNTCGEWPEPACRECD